MMKQRWGLDSNDRHLEIPGVSNNTTGAKENQQLNPSWNLFCCFTCMQSRAVIKSDVSVNSVHGNKRKKHDVNITLVFALVVTFSKRTQWTYHFRGLLAAESLDLRVQFLQSFRIFKYRSLFYAIIAIKHDFRMH